MKFKTGSLVALLLAIPSVHAAGIDSILNVLTLDFINVTDQTRMIALLRFVIFVISFTILNQAFKRAGKFTSESEGLLARLIGTKPHSEHGLFETKQAGLIAFVMAIMIALFMPAGFLLTILSVYTTAAVLLFVLVPFIGALVWAKKVKQPWLRLIILLIAMWVLGIVFAFSSTGINAIPGMSISTASNLDSILKTVIAIAQLLIIIGIVISIIQMFGGKSKSDDEVHVSSPADTHTTTEPSETISTPSTPAQRKEQKDQVATAHALIKQIEDIKI